MSKQRTAIPAIIINPNPSKKQKKTITKNYISIIETELTKIEKLKKQLIIQEAAKKQLVDKIETLQQSLIDSEFVISRVFMFMDKYGETDNSGKMYEILTRVTQNDIEADYKITTYDRLELLTEISEMFLQPLHV